MAPCSILLPGPAPQLAQASECGCLDAVLELMRAVLASNGAGGKENGRGSSAVQRQACMALRNIAVRSALAAPGCPVPCMVSSACVRRGPPA